MNLGGRGAREVIIEEGALIRERQEIIRLPDPTQMQVEAKINEAKIGKVEEGMSATIRLDAFHDIELHGVVEDVAELPAPTSWFAGNIKEYETKIRIENPPKGIKPGLTAEVRILVDRRQDVVQVPVQALIEHGGEFYCVREKAGQLSVDKVEVGPSNDKFVVIESGLAPDDEILLNIAAVRDELDLPEVPESPPGRDGCRPPARPQEGRQRLVVFVAVFQPLGQEQRRATRGDGTARRDAVAHDGGRR